MATNTIRASAMHRTCATLLAGCCAAALLGGVGVGAASAQGRWAPGHQPVRGLHRRRRGLAGWGELSQHRDRALDRRQPQRPTQPDRGLAAGPLVQWRLAGGPRRRQLRRRCHVADRADSRHHRVHGRQLQACVRPLGDDRAQRHGLLHEPVVRPGPAERLVRPQRDAGEPLHRRREVLERPDHADPGPRRAGPERQELDHRRRHQLQLRLRGLGPVAGLHAPTAGGRGAGRRHGRGAGRRACGGRRGRGAPAGAAAAAAGRPARWRGGPGGPGVLRGPGLPRAHHERRAELAAGA